MPVPTELDLVADRCLDLAAPGEALEVLVMHEVETEVRVHDGAVESFTSAESHGVGIRIVADGRQGFAHCGTLDPVVVEDTLAAARDNLRFATADDANGLPVPDGTEPPTLEIDGGPFTEVPPSVKIDAALALERRIRETPGIVGVESADYNDARAVAVVRSTTGIDRATVESACSLTAFSLADDDGDICTGFGVGVGRSFGDLDVSSTADDAVGRALRMRGAVRPASARLTVIFDPWVTAQLLSLIGELFSGLEVARGRSFVADHLGGQMAAGMLTVVDDPTDPRWFGATSVDGEGLATRPVTLIDAGVAAAMLHDSYSARLAGERSTGSAVRGGAMGTPRPGPQSVRLVGGDTSPGDLIAGVSDGVYVTEVQGLHSGVNNVSGDFSVGIEGLLIRGGELATPVREATIASTLPRMLAHVVGIGDDLVALPLDATGTTLVVEDLTLSGGGV